MVAAQINVKMNPLNGTILYKVLKHHTVMTNKGDKPLLPNIFVGGMGLILLGIGIGGLGSLPSNVSIMTFPRMELMMGCDIMMMDMMMGPRMVTPIGPFGSTAATAVSIYLAVLIGIYVGLIAIGGYMIYRAVAPVTSQPMPTRTA